MEKYAKLKALVKAKNSAQGVAGTGPLTTLVAEQLLKRDLVEWRGGVSDTWWVAKPEAERAWHEMLQEAIRYNGR